MLKLGVFSFMSVDTLILADKLVSMIEDGGWIEFTDGKFDTLTINNRDDIILRIMNQASGTSDVIDLYPLEIGIVFQDYLESVVTDTRIYTEFVLSQSDEYKALSEWLLADNYFSIGHDTFSKYDLVDSYAFINKLFKIMTMTYVMHFSSGDGLELLKSFFFYCRKSLMGEE